MSIRSARPSRSSSTSYIVVEVSAAAMLKASIAALARISFAAFNSFSFRNVVRGRPQVPCQRSYNSLRLKEDFMIDLYAAGTSNGMRARIALEECGLAYKLHPIALEKGENKTPQFTALNPNAQIPVIVDHEGPGGKPLTVSQSSAILIYAGEKSGKFMPKEPAARAAFWQALMSASTDMTPTLGSIFQIVRGKDPHGPSADLFRPALHVWATVAQLGNRAFGARVASVEREVGERHFIAGGVFLLAERRVPHFQILPPATVAQTWSAGRKRSARALP